MPATHHIICVHGIGTHSKTWAESDKGGDEPQTFKELFDEKWGKYPKVKAAFTVKLHSICYDEEIEKIFQFWADYAQGLKDSLVSSPLLKAEAGWFTDAVDKATAAKGSADWRYTHLMDLLMFAASPTLQNRLVNYAGAQVIKIIQDHAANDEISLIGHSMGCAMAHKVIQALYNEGVEVKPGKFETIKGDFRFSNVTMVANTSFALSRDREGFYKGKLVRPSSRPDEGCCSSWINANHRLDPVARFMPFEYREEPGWLDPVVAAAGDHQDIRLTRLSSKSLHSLTHYYRDPSFHLPYLELLSGETLTKKQRDDAFDEFEKLTPEGKFKGIVSHLETLDVSDTDSFKALFEALKSFHALIK